MDSKCSQLINLYNDLLSKKGGVCNSINKLDKDNMNWLRYKILEIKNIKENINNILDKYIEIRKEYNQFYSNNFNNFYKKNNLQLPDFSKVEVPEQPNDNYKYKLLFIDPRLAGEEKQLLEEIRDNVRDKDNNNIPVWNDSGLLDESWTIEPETQPERIYKKNKDGKYETQTELYAIWIRDIEISKEDEQMLRYTEDNEGNRLYDKYNSMSYDDIYTTDKNGKEITMNIYINPITNKPYTREDFLSLGEYLILFTKKYQEGIILDKEGYFKSCSLDSVGGVPSAYWSDDELDVNRYGVSVSDSDGRFRVTVSLHS